MPFRPVVIAPTFNNAATLAEVLARVDAQRFDAIVVNDGSTDQTSDILAGWLRRPRASNASVVTHVENQGKAAALKTAFEHAVNAGYTHALSIDTDGQLAPEQAAEMFALAREHPVSLVVGVRDERASDYPAASRLGRRVANVLIFMESGLRVADSQCGLRVYPLAATELFACRAKRYGFETEVIVRAGWAGRSVVETPARCTYFSGTQRVSHFRPWRDTFRAVGMHFRLVGSALMPRGRPALGTGNTARDERPNWKRFLHWLDPRDAWRQLRSDGPRGTQRTAIAAGLALGAWIGCVPVYGVQALIALYFARRLNLNPVAMVLGTQIAFPPVGIVVSVCAVALGHLLLHGGLPPASDFHLLLEGLGGIVKLGRWFLLDWLVGSFFVGAVCMVVVFFLSEWALRCVTSTKSAAS